MTPSRTLIEKYLEGMIAPDELSELERMLRDDRTVADAFAGLTRLDSELHACFQQEANIQQTTARLQKAIDAVPMGKQRSSERSRVWWPGAVKRRALLVAASVLLAMVGIYYGFRQTEPIGPPDGQAKNEKRTTDNDASQPIANLGEVQGDVVVVDGNVRTPVKNGQELFRGQKLSTRGEDSFAVVTFKDSSRVELGADTTISLPAQNDQGLAKNQQIMLQEGSISAEVAQQPAGQPMIFTTPHTYFVSAGSKVSVLALFDETYIEPEDGLVDMTTADGKNLQIKTGSFVVATKEGQSLKKRAAVVVGAGFRPLLKEDSGPITSLAFAPDSQTLATGTAGAAQGGVRLWDTATGQPAGITIELGKRWPRALAYSPDGHFLACCGNDASVRILALPDGKECFVLRFQRPVYTLAYSPDGNFLATAGNSRDVSEIKLWHAATGKLAADLKASGVVVSLAISPNSQTLATGYRDGLVRLWDIDARAEARSFVAHTLEVTTLAFAPDGRALASGSRDGTVVLWDPASGGRIAFEDPASGKRVEAINAHPRGVRKLAFSLDGPPALATIGNDPAVKLWDLTTGREKAIYRGFNFSAPAAFSPNGRYLATGGKDLTVRLWDLSRVR